MSQLRKTLVILMALTMLLTLGLAGCATPAQQSTPQLTTQATTEAAQAEATATIAPTATDLPEVNLIWYFIGSFPQPDQDAVFTAFSKLVDSKIHATVDMRAASFGDYDQKMQVVIASGESWDICFTSNWACNYVQNASKGAYLPLDDLMPKYAPIFMQLMDAKFLPALKINGKIYAVPNVQQFPRATCAVVPKDLADKAKLDLSNLKDNDLKQMEPYLEMSYNVDPTREVEIKFNDLGDSLFSQEWIAGWNCPGAIDVSDASTKVFNQFESNSFKSFVQTMRDWNAKGWLHAQENVAKTDYLADEKAGKVMLYLGSAYWPGSEKPRPIGQYGGREYCYAKIAKAVATTGGVTATLQAISRNCKNPERAMMLLNLVNVDQDVNDLINFGIKGVHYNLDEKGYAISVKDSKYSPYQVWMWNSPVQSRSVSGMPTQADFKANILKYDQDAQTSPLLGFTFSPDAVKGEIGKCNAVVDEFNKSISLGMITDDQYNQFISKLKDAGSDAIIAEMQKQVDAWKAAKTN